MKAETRWHRVLSKTVGSFSQFLRSRYLVEGSIVLLLALATVILNWKMIRDGISGQGDLKWHLPWLQHFFKQLAEGIWYPRWLAGTNYGYGSPTFVFQPPLVFYLGSWLKFSGLDTQDAVIVLFSLALFLAGLTFYIYGRKKWGTLASLMGALAYMTAPYIAFDIHWRGGIASVFVQAWIPLIWYLTEQSLSSSKWRLSLVLAWAGLALTHVPGLLLCAVIWVPCTLLALLNKPWKTVVATILSAGIGLGIASIFLLPAIWEQSFFDIEFHTKYVGGISSNLIGIGMPLFPFSRITYIFTHQVLAIVILTVTALVCSRLNNSPRREIWYWFGFALILAFLMSSLSEPIWLASSTLQKIQFAWRLLTFFSFVGAALCAITVREVLKLRFSFKLLLTPVIIGILLINFNYSYKSSHEFIALRNPGRANIDHLVYIKRILDDPYTDKLRDYAGYRPALKNGRPSPPTPVIGQPRISLIDGQAQIQIEQWISYERSFKITASEPSTIRVRTYYYPAWHLYLNQKPHPIAMADDGTMKFQLEPGIYQVNLRYQWTPAFIAGGILSILSIIVLIIFHSKRFLSASR